VKDLQKLLERDAVELAPLLLGAILERAIGDHIVRVRIVEVEAYNQSDAASHSFKGKTPRTDIMFGPAGHLYVYFTYGMHYCCNIVTGKEGEGSAILIRAVEPLNNIDYLEQVRGKTGVDMTNGPAKLCQALAIDTSMNGHNLQNAPLKLIIQPPIADDLIVRTTRIGITKDRHRPWRFYLKDNPYVSQARGPGV
jgi:DNA-3-methyladenine glycosylase